VEVYDRAFYAGLEDTALPSARRILPWLLSVCPIESAVDVGCGDGSWLAVLRELGVGTVFGVDGVWIAEDQLRIPLASFQRSPLDRPLAIPGHYDLALSLEVGEHLPADRAESFVGELCALAPLVLFSAAIPNQRGPGHVNEQWPSWWADRFAAHGFRAIDAVRPRFWNDPDVTWWYRQNMMLFASAAALERWPALRTLADPEAPTPLPLVHPEILRSWVRLGEPGFGRWFRMGGRALARSLRKHSRTH